MLVASMDPHQCYVKMLPRCLGFIGTLHRFCHQNTDNLYPEQIYIFNNLATIAQ